MNGLALAATSLPLACIGYGLIEARLYRTQPYRIPILPRGAEPVSILQVSDLHFRLPMRRLAAFMRRLHGDTYDLVLATGDLLGEPAAVDECLDLLNGLKGRFGRFFVFGAADYYAPKFKNYVDYFVGRRRLGTRRNPTDRLRAGLVEEGWTDLTNLTVYIDVAGDSWQVTGLDDPYLGRDDRSLLVRDSQVSFALCVVHDPSPYEEAARGGFDLTVSGHTHGGQVRLPLIGAVVTNSDLPRRLARGLHRIGSNRLFVNPGLGTGKYAPFRFLCPPEASVLELSAGEVRTQADNDCV